MHSEIPIYERIWLSDNQPTQAPPWISYHASIGHRSCLFQYSRERASINDTESINLRSTYTVLDFLLRIRAFNPFPFRL